MLILPTYCPLLFLRGEEECPPQWDPSSVFLQVPLVIALPDAAPCPASLKSLIGRPGLFPPDCACLLLHRTITPQQRLQTGGAITAIYTKESHFGCHISPVKKKKKGC